MSFSHRLVLRSIHGLDGQIPRAVSHNRALQNMRIPCWRAKSIHHRTLVTAKDPAVLDPKQASADHDHCVDLVQQRDREGYLCGLLMPAHARKSYFAIRAFNAEVASIKDGSDRRRLETGDAGTSLGLRMRMQWWRDALDELYQYENNDDPSSSTLSRDQSSVAGFLSSSEPSSSACWRNPVVRALHRAIHDSNLTRRFLERLLDAREADLAIRQMATMEDSIMYAEDTCSSLLYLSLETAGVRDDAADIVASHAGIGMGLTNALRSTLHRASVGEMSLPAELFAQQIPSIYFIGREDQTFEIPPEIDERLRSAVQYMAYEASSQLTRARELQRDVPKAGRSCLLPAVPVIQYLARLKEVKYDLWHPKLAAEESRLSVLTMLGKAWLTGTL